MHLSVGIRKLTGHSPTLRTQAGWLVGAFVLAAVLNACASGVPAATTAPESPDRTNGLEPSPAVGEQAAPEVTPVITGFNVRGWI
ncbi:MAG: hypothetical protein ACE5FI_11175 [Anaerolineales bacterium]